MPKIRHEAELHGLQQEQSAQTKEHAAQLDEQVAPPSPAVSSPKLTPLEHLDADFARVKEWRKWNLSRILKQAETLHNFIDEEDFALQWMGTEDLAVATKLHHINQVYSNRRSQLVGKSSAPSDDLDDSDDDNDDASKGPPSNKGKQIITSSSCSDEILGGILAKSTMETHGCGETSKVMKESKTHKEAPEQPTAISQQATPLPDPNNEPPEQQPTTSEYLKMKMLTEDAEDTPTIAEVFIQERRATTKFISNAEVSCLPTGSRALCPGTL
ncbi:unnamed protein product, partial [Cuscuta europaea]